MSTKVSRLVTVTCLLAFVLIALVLRIIPPYSQIFADGWVKFASPDVYYFMRQVDHLVYNFPNLMPVDPYFWLSGGKGSGELNFFEYLLSSVILLLGAGSPTTGLVDLVGVYFPVVLGALAVIPGYFLGKVLFGRWGGLLTAGLLAIMPGEYLARTELGSTDRDYLQVFLVLTTMLFTSLAVKLASDSELFAGGYGKADRRIVLKVAFYSLIAGISLALFLLTWKGAFIFSAIILIFIIGQSIIDCLRGRPAGYLFFTGTVIFITAALIYLPFVQGTTFRVSLILHLVIVVAAWIVSWVVDRRKLWPFLYPTLLVALGAGLFGVAYTVFPLILEQIIASVVGNLLMTSLGQTVSENLPIMFPAGQFTMYALWVNYTTGFYISLIAIGMLSITASRGSRSELILLLAWSVIMLLLTLMMRRFAIFYTLNVALLTAYACLKFLEYLGVLSKQSSSHSAQPQVQKTANRDKKTRNLSKARVPLLSTILGWLPVLLIVFLPNIPTSVYVSGVLSFAPSDAWCQSLNWLNENTPDPYGNSTFYYQNYTKLSDDKLYPDSAYAVTAWWDYGYWIVRTGHRLPNCDPGGGNRGPVAAFFTDQDMASAYKKALALRSKYVMLDYQTVTTMWDSVRLHAGLEQSQFFDGYYRPISGTTKLEPVVLYHPEYYRSLAVRLYNFDGAAVTPQSVRVIAWEERLSVEGPYKHLTYDQVFPGYEEAVKFISAKETGNYRIVSGDPFRSPVPLEPVAGYRLAYSSEGKVKSAGGVELPEVKVFEYLQ